MWFIFSTHHLWPFDSKIKIPIFLRKLIWNLRHFKGFFIKLLGLNRRIFICKTIPSLNLSLYRFEIRISNNSTVFQLLSSIGCCCRYSWIAIDTSHNRSSHSSLVMCTSHLKRDSSNSDDKHHVILLSYDQLLNFFLKKNSSYTVKLTESFHSKYFSPSKSIILYIYEKGVTT